MDETRGQPPRPAVCFSLICLTFLFNDNTKPRLVEQTSLCRAKLQVDYIKKERDSISSVNMHFSKSMLQRIMNFGKTRLSYVPSRYSYLNRKLKVKLAHFLRLKSRYIA